MEKKINFCKERQETQRGVELSDGRIISLFDKDNKFYLRFDTPLDLERGVCMEKQEGSNSVTLNSLIKSGKAKEVFGYDACEYNEDIFPDDFWITNKKVSEIQRFFKKSGYSVTNEAIMHQLTAWDADMKSGFRDEENGYHLFTPCGCNPLSIRLSTLHPLCEDWQTTYEC